MDYLSLVIGRMDLCMESSNCTILNNQYIVNSGHISHFLWKETCTSWMSTSLMVRDMHPWAICISCVQLISLSVCMTFVRPLVYMGVEVSKCILQPSMGMMVLMLILEFTVSFIKNNKMLLKITCWLKLNLNYLESHL